MEFGKKSQNPLLIGLFGMKGLCSGDQNPGEYAMEYDMTGALRALNIAVHAPTTIIVLLYLATAANSHLV